MKSKLVRCMILLGVIALLATPVFAGGSAESKDVVADDGSGLQAKLEYWSSWSANEPQALILEDAAKDFNKLNPGVKINFTFNGRDNRYLTASAIQSGTKVDMMDANADNISALWRDYIADLSPYFSKTYPTTNGKPFLEELMPSMTKLSLALFDDKYVFIPFVPQAFMIFCNKGIFEEAGVTSYPKTWDEFLGTCEQIKRAGYIPITSDNAYNTSWFGYYVTRLIGDDEASELATDPQAWKNPKVLEAAKAIEELARRGYYDPNIASNTYPNGQQSMVINENIAMYINGTWLPNEVATTTPDGFKWGSFAFPTVPGGVDDQTAGAYSTYGISVSNKTTEQEREAAFAFAVHLTTKFDQAFADDANIVPVNVNSTWPEDLLEAREVLFGYSTRYPAQTSLTKGANSKQIILDAAQKLMGGLITAEEFVAQASRF